jgi:patatin-related protein
MSEHSRQEPCVAQPSGESSFDLDREVRLGLVLYGGVSLAVYMCGVAEELHRAVRGRGVYGLVKALIRSHVVVDIVSGTSAGGINGALLAHCLARNLDFSGFSSLWRREADLGLLLRSDRVSTDQARSLLDSEGHFQSKLEEAILSLEGWQAAPLDVPSKVDALDLFVTTTDYNGRVTGVLDDVGDVLRVKSHRRVYHLEHRAGRGAGGDFHPKGMSHEEHAWALATMCRSTASFPFAFAPVRIPPEDAASAAGRRDDRAGARRLLRAWLRADDGETLALVDGGVLDNKPFTHTISEIFKRTAHREVDRKLVYVDPDPELFGREPVPDPDPDVLHVVEASLTRLPSYQSIANDLRAIDEHNGRVQSYNELLSGVRDRIVARSVRAVQDGSRSGDAGAAKCPDGAERVVREIYFKARLGDFADRLSDRITESRGVVAPDEARRLAALASRLREDLTTARLLETRAGELLRRHDVEYRLRRLFGVTYFLYDLLYPGAAESIRMAPACRPAGRRLLQGLNRLIHALEMIEALELRVLGEATAQWRGEPPREVSWRALEERIAPLLTYDPARTWEDSVAGWLEEARVWIPDPARDEGWSSYLRDDASDDASTVKSHGGGTIAQLEKMLEARLGAGAPVAGARNILDGVDEVARALLDRAVPLLGADGGGPHAGAAVQRTFERFEEEIDEVLFPLEYVSGLREKDRIELVRVSPGDAQLGLCRRNAADKTAGDALHHFGAFLKRSWRSNDILWGRLDGVTMLLRTLLTPERIGQIAAEGELRKEIRKHLRSITGADTFDGEDIIARWFPHSARAERAAREGTQPPPVELGRLASWLEDLLSDDDVACRGAADAVQPPGSLERGGILDVLATAAQIEIVACEVPKVIEDAMAQAREWGAAGEGGRGTGSRVDPVVADWTAMVGPPESPEGGVLDVVRFFRDAYAVGRERPAPPDVPAAVLAAFAGKSLLVIRKMRGRAARTAPPFLRFVLGAIGIAALAIGRLALAGNVALRGVSRLRRRSKPRGSSGAGRRDHVAEAHRQRPAPGGVSEPAHH